MYLLTLGCAHTTNTVDWEATMFKFSYLVPSVACLNTLRFTLDIYICSFFRATCENNGVNMELLNTNSAQDKSSLWQPMTVFCTTDIIVAAHAFIKIVHCVVHAPIIETSSKLNGLDMTKFYAICTQCWAILSLYHGSTDHQYTSLQELVYWAVVTTNNKVTG